MIMYELVALPWALRLSMMVKLGCDGGTVVPMYPGVDRSGRNISTMTFLRTSV
jgi:hypothetical protein